MRKTFFPSPNGKVFLRHSNISIMLLFFAPEMRWWHENRVGSVNMAVYEEERKTTKKSSIIVLHPLIISKYYHLLS
jgi:hypothetical protein